MRSMKFFWVLPLFVLFTACGKKSDTGSNELTGLPLASSDAKAFQTMDEAGARQVDTDYNHTFTSIFGGTDAASVNKFYIDRVRHFIDLDRSKFKASNDLPNDKWRTPPANPTETPIPHDPSVKVGASNIGISLWLQGVINDAQVVVYDQDNLRIPVRSSRSGIIALGAGYLASVTSKRTGKSIPLPAEYRQAILLHEGRHSDCTGGLTQTQINTIRDVSDADDFEKKFPVMACGHLHTICKSGDYAGLAACDNEGFGAYTVGAVYALAAYNSSQDPIAKEILKSTFIDYFSRMESIDWNDLLSGKLHLIPDMTSSGVSGI